MSYIADNLFSHMMAKKTHSKIRYSLQTAKKKSFRKKEKKKKWIFLKNGTKFEA